MQATIGGDGHAANAAETPFGVATPYAGGLLRVEYRAKVLRKPDELKRTGESKGRRHVGAVARAPYVELEGSGRQGDGATFSLLCGWHGWRTGSQPAERDSPRNGGQRCGSSCLFPTSMRGKLPTGLIRGQCCVYSDERGGYQPVRVVEVSRQDVNHQLGRNEQGT